MIVLKILAAPVMVALSLLAAMVTFLFCVASAVCELGCIVLTLLSLILFIGGQTVGGIVFLVLAFLVSPFGVPAIAEWVGGQAALGQVRPAGFHHRLILRDKMSQS